MKSARPISDEVHAESSQGFIFTFNREICGQTQKVQTVFFSADLAVMFDAPAA